MGDSPETTTIQVTRDVHQRLSQRRTPEDLSYNDVVNRLLADSRQSVPFEDLIMVLENGFESMVSVYVNHLPTHRNPKKIEIWIYTPDTSEYEERITNEVIKENTHVLFGMPPETLELPYDVYATCDGPKTLDTDDGTPIYMSDAFVGAFYLDMGIGMAYLEEKLTNPDEWVQPQGAGLEQIHDRMNAGDLELDS